MFHKGFQGTCPRKMGILLTNDKWDVADGNGEAEVTTRQRGSKKTAWDGTFFSPTLRLYEHEIEGRAWSLGLGMVLH